MNLLADFMLNKTNATSTGSVAVFGAGIAGLSAAYELSRRGYRVSVYEALPSAGGFFRSARSPGEGNLPTEYSWHGMGPWYHNAFDLLRQIPFDDSGSVFDKALSRPIDFGILPDDAKAQFFDKGWRSIPRMFGFSSKELLRWSWLMLKTWSSNKRSEQSYSRLNAARQWERCLSEGAAQTWRSCFGPWIGSDWTRASLHHAGQFFRKQLITKPSHDHPADEEGPAWKHGAGDGWLLLRGPSSEVWIERWVADLEQRSVSFFWNESLDRLRFDGGSITGAELSTDQTVVPNLFLAGAHTRTEADVWSIEGAVESGRRAARGIDPSVTVIRQYKPAWLRALGALDDLCYRARWAHILDLSLGAAVVALAAILVWLLL